MVKEICVTLYRYDLKQPPAKWDAIFFNCECYDVKLGHKNKADLFFFTDSVEIANDLGLSSAKGSFKDEYFLTSFLTPSKFKIIDFSNKENIYQMIRLLYDLGIDVLTDDFKTYEADNDFSQLKNIFESAELEQDFIKKYKIIGQLKINSKSNYYDISLFGQRLTDFENGIKFKVLAKSIISDIDGYRWREFDDERGYSYCLFDSKKLPLKKTEIIAI